MKKYNTIFLVDFFWKKFLKIKVWDKNTNLCLKLFDITYTIVVK